MPGNRNRLHAHPHYRNSSPLQSFDAAAVEAQLDPARLIETLRDAFCKGANVPLRHHHAIPGTPKGQDATLLLMPAWGAGTPPTYIGIKSVTVHPDNPTQGRPSVQGVYLLLDGATGTPVAMIDGPSLTARRTAAASALAATYLARKDAKHLTVIGTGRLCPELILAHATARPLEQVSIWGRNKAAAHTIADSLSDAPFSVQATDDLETAVRVADIVSCATTALRPVFDGGWLQPGTHIDLVGGFRPDMREADDEAIRRARVFVDTRDGATREAGDIVQPLASGILQPNDIAADLFDLCRNKLPGRESEMEITLFKSVGTALEDLAAAELLMAETAP